MNSIDIVRAGREAYYLAQGKDDYYTGQLEPEGVFLGSGAQALHILGKTIQEQDPILKQLFNGKSPDNKTLREGMHTIREYHRLENPETGKTVKETAARKFSLHKSDVEAIRAGNVDSYSDRLQAFCHQHRELFPDGKLPLAWVKPQGKQGTWYQVQNPETQKALTTESSRQVQLNRFEVAQIKSGNPLHYSKRLQALITKHGIDEPTKWLKTEHHRSVVAYDNVFSAPKDVSILWSLAPDQPSQRQLLQVHEQATRAALSYLEQQAFIRKGRGGTEQEKAQATFAVFTHTTSRDLDPQLHSHAVMLNFGIAADGTTGCLDGRQILAARYAAGMVYQNELRRGLERGFGVVTYDQPFVEGKGVSFGIKGISQSIKDEFSNRSQKIQQRIDPGMSSKQKRAQVLKSRAPKDPTVDSTKLMLQWRARGREQGFNWQRVVGKARSQSLTSQTDYKRFYREVTTRIRSQERKGTVGEHQLVSAVMSASRGRLSSSQALNITDGLKEHFLRGHTQTNGKTLYTLNDKGHKAMNYRTAAERLGAALQGLKKARYQNRLAILYATGKISSKQYKRYTQGKGLPKSVIGIRTHQALGLIGTRQARYLLQKQARPPSAPPKPYYHNKTITKLTIFPETKNTKPEPQSPTRTGEKEQER